MPLLWASYREWRLLRRQNSLEEGLLRLLRSRIPASVGVVILADRGFGRAEWATVGQLYGRRLSVEELFREAKNRRNGLALRNTRIEKAERFDRFLLIVALVYLLLSGPGLWAKLAFDPSAWCTNRRARECSVFYARPGDAASNQRLI